MERIILIETSTTLCSVAIAEEGKIVCSRESGEDRSHASLTAVFIDELLRERGCGVADCSAVCVSEGPGSYTGLRVGVSTAKGLCFGAGIPLLSVSTLEVLVAQAIEDAAKTGETFSYIVPMIDARRMEVYTEVFSGKGEKLGDTQAKIIDSDSFSDLLNEGPVLFIGDGAGKCESTILHSNARFRQLCPKATAMLAPAVRELHEGNFRDTAYFEPFYLKEFVATTSKKKLF